MKYCKKCGNLLKNKKCSKCSKKSSKNTSKIAINSLIIYFTIVSYIGVFFLSAVTLYANNFLPEYGLEVFFYFILYTLFGTIISLACLILSITVLIMSAVVKHKNICIIWILNIINIILNIKQLSFYFNR